MKASKFTEAQKAFILKQGEEGALRPANWTAYTWSFRLIFPGWERS